MYVITNSTTVNVQESKFIGDEDFKTKSDPKCDVSILRGQEKLEGAQGVHEGNISLYLLKSTNSFRKSSNTFLMG